MKIKLGFIGTGMMGMQHVETFKRTCFDQSEGVALFDPHASNRNKALDLLPEITVYERLDDIINSDVDAVVISTPNATHADIAIKALHAGKHVMMEKPVATSRDDCLRLLNAADKARRNVFVAHELRYSPYFQKIKEIVADGDIGQPHTMWCKEFRPPFMRKVGNWIQDSRLSGGAIVDKNCHHFDLMNWWINSRPRRVCAFGNKNVVEVIGGIHEVIDNASIIFEYENGGRGSLILCLFAPERHGDNLEMGVIGDAGLLQTFFSRAEIHVWKRDGIYPTPIIYKITDKNGVLSGHTGFEEEHIAFLDSIVSGRPAVTDIRNVVEGTLMAIAAEDSIKHSRIIELC